MAGRRQALEYARFLVDRVPGYEHASLVALSTQIGVRETPARLRRLPADARRRPRRAALRRRRSGCAGRRSRTTTAAPTPAGTTCPTARSSGIPYRTLLVRDARNVLVAGRCFSATHDAHASVRSMAQCMAMGQAAGTAAAIAVGSGRDPRDIDVDALRERLASRRRDPRERGAGRSHRSPRPLDDVRPDRPRRHRPIGPGRHVRARAPHHRGRPARRDEPRLPARRRRQGRRGADGREGARTARGRRRDAGGLRARCAEARRVSADATGVHVIAPTGLHHERFYDAAPLEPRGRPLEELAALFVADITDGIDAEDYGGPIVRRTSHRAGVIKVARIGRRSRPSVTGGSSTAAALAQRRDRLPDPHPLRGRDGRARAGAPARRRWCRPGAHRAVARRQGRRPRLSPRAGGDRRVPRVRRRVPLEGDEPERHAPAARMRWPRTACSTTSCSGSTRPGAATGPRLRRLAGMTYLLDGFSRELWRAASDAAVRHDSSSTNPARAFAFAEDRPGGIDDRTARCTTVVGSHARPGWLDLAVAAADRGELGPADIREVQDDAVDVALRDQEDAGIDVVSRRRDAPRRLLHGRVLPPPDGRRAAAVRASAGRRRPRPAAPVRGPRAHRGTRRPRRRRGVPLRARRARAGRSRSPSPARSRCRAGSPTARARSTPTGSPRPRRSCPSSPPSSRGSSRPARRTSRSTSRHRPSTPRPRPSSRRCSTPRSTPIVGRVRLAAHLCFGNYLGRPLARRAYRPVLEQALAFRVDELVLEWANREMAELDVAADIAAAGRDLAAGVVDVKSYHLEIGRRGRRAHRRGARGRRARGAADARARLRLQPDRALGDRAKLRALVAGRDLVLGRHEGAHATWTATASRCSAPGSSATSTR